MSGMGAGHNKYESCEGCPHRCPEPNCHMTCRGNLFREELRKRKKEGERSRRNSSAMTAGCKTHVEKKMDRKWKKH